MRRVENSIFWVDATSIGTANRSFEGIASKLAPGSNFPNPEAARTFVLKAFEDLADPVLMVFDNYDKPAEFPNVRDYLWHRAKIIFTSRHTDAKRLGNSIEVEAMTLDEGIQLLLLQSGYERTDENVVDARQIVEDLGGLALAIDQAATYIGARHVPLKSFPEVFAKRRSSILRHTPTHWEYSKTRLEARDKPLSVFTTWEMSFEQLQVTEEEERESLVHLLTLGAFVDTRDISEGLFSLYALEANRPKWLEYFLDGDKWDSDKYQDSIVRLLSVSLVTSIDIMATDARFSFHPLIAEWLKLRIDDKIREQYTKEAIHVVRLFVDNGDKVDMPIRDKGEILSHLDAVIAGDEMLHVNDHHVSHTLRDAMVSFASFYRRLGRYHETKHLIQRALNSDHEVTPTIRNLLANMYCDQGDLKEAENLYNQVLLYLEEIPPTKDPNEQIYSTRLGFLYWTQDDKLDPSGKMYEGAYTANFSDFDPWFVSGLSTKNGLAVAYMKEGRLNTAEKLFEQSLEGRERASGSEDRYTLEIVNHLGALKVLKGDYPAAEPLLLRALAGLEKHYGPGSMSTQYICCNLGLCYLESGQIEKADHMLGRAARDFEGGFGPIHPSTLSTVHNQGLLYLRQGKGNASEAARAKFERAIEGWEASGEGVAKSEGDSKYCLATIYELLEDKRADAAPLFHEAAVLYELALGKAHPQTKEAFQRAEEVRNLTKVAGLKVG